eukprot:TRINITY_DN1094_c2_g3_i1.p1 TRINITY_DN1094_c2_g3~~TRINITY_DN1094_c2_g3_i1.p1  ORF type:complete len:274 (+),score=20.64 TRINITY_DN1094_c2_g3_i1:157-978(+)
MATMSQLPCSLKVSHIDLKHIQVSAGLQATSFTTSRAGSLSSLQDSRTSFGYAGQSTKGLSSGVARRISLRRISAPGGISHGIDRSNRRGPVLVHAFIDWAALPAWLVKTLATRVYPSKPCSEGRYLDPRTESCVYICQPGYAYDAATKACVLVRNIQAMPSTVVLRKAVEDDFPDCGQGFFYDGEQDACVPAELAKAEPKRTWGQIAVTWLARRLLKFDDTSCPVGFYFDPTGKACVPLCMPGFLYDPDLKKCVPASELLYQQQEAYKRRAK